MVRPIAMPAPPPSMTSRTSSSTRRGRRRARAAQEEHGHAHAGHHPGHGARWRSAPGATAGTGTLIIGAPMSWAMIAAITMASVSRRIRPSSHTSGSIESLELRLARLLEDLAQQLERGAVTGSSMSIRVMCFTPVHPSAAARGTLATSRSSSSKAEPARPVRLMER